MEVQAHKVCDVGWRARFRCRDACTAKEFEELVQRNMAANCGVDFEEFCQLLLCMTESELKVLQISQKSKWRCIFNLHRIRQALEVLLPHMPAGEVDAEREPSMGRSGDGTPKTDYRLPDLAVLRNQMCLAEQRNIVALLNILESAISGCIPRSNDSAH